MAFPPGTIGPDFAPVVDAFKKAALSAASAAPRLAGALAAAGFVLLTPGNTQGETHAIGDGLRVRTAPGQRSATVELRVGEGLLGTGIGERWKALPAVQAAWVDAGRRRYIAIDPPGLDAALRAHGIAMAKPPSDGDKPDDERRPVGPGHNSEHYGQKMEPDGGAPGPQAPLAELTAWVASKQAELSKSGAPSTLGKSPTHAETLAAIEAADEAARKYRETHSGPEEVPHIRGFSPEEARIIVEGRGIYWSPHFSSIRVAHELGHVAVVSINGQVMQYEPALPRTDQAVTMQGAFVFGPSAFISNLELGASIAQELYRLRIGQTGRADAQHARDAAIEARAFADRAASYIVRKSL